MTADQQGHPSPSRSSEREVPRGPGCSGSGSGLLHTSQCCSFVNHELVWDHQAFRLGWLGARIRDSGDCPGPHASWHVPSLGPLPR